MRPVGWYDLKTDAEILAAAQRRAAELDRVRSICLICPERVTEKGQNGFRDALAVYCDRETTECQCKKLEGESPCSRWERLPLPVIPASNNPA